MEKNLKQNQLYFFFSRCINLAGPAITYGSKYFTANAGIRETALRAKDLSYLVLSNKSRY
jgi:hypothetical protein